MIYNQNIKQPIFEVILQKKSIIRVLLAPCNVSASICNPWQLTVSASLTLDFNNSSITLAQLSKIAPSDLQQLVYIKPDAH